jgi:hypothetical protein
MVRPKGCNADIKLAKKPTEYHKSRVHVGR